ncbi:glycosyltransferase [Vibrio sp. E150_011]
MIIHVVYDCVPGVFRGGVQKVVVDLALAQYKNGANVEIWALKENKNCPDIDYKGLKIKYFDSYTVFGVKLSFELINSLMLIKKDIDIIHCHSTFHPINFQVAYFSVNNNVKLACHTHGALDVKLFSGLKFQHLKKRVYIKFFESYLLRNSSCVFALTHDEKKQLRYFGLNENVLVLPNGIGFPKYYNPDDKKAGLKLKQELSISYDSKVLLFVGRIVRKKGITYIVDALKIALTSNSNVILIIAGDPNQDEYYTNELKRIIISNNISDNVIWYGFVSDEFKPALFSASDVFIHASYSEGMAMSVLEAMSYSIPCIVTPGCYMQEARDFGALIEVQQRPIALAEAIVKMLEDPRALELFGKASSDYVRTNHSWCELADISVKAYKI